MKVAFPTMDEQGLQSSVHNHFGSARHFVLVETENEKVDIQNNSDMNHLHGQCQPLAALGGSNPEAVIVGGIGAGALRKLMASGIKVYRAVEGTVQDNVKLIKTGQLPEYTLDQTCSGHGATGDCVH
jgi:predicted Fe-Mo cluster-binding NifX family protein